VSGYVLDGRYRLIERIASGGMGEVWRGVDQILGRPVAVKLLSATHASDEQFRARFRAEARFAAALSHPGIARVFDYGETQFSPLPREGQLLQPPGNPRGPLGGAYLVMELVNGEPLSAILERVGRLAPEVTLDIVGQAAHALDAAHQAGIVHRDIKPGNLLIMADGTTKITDFGIAKAREAQAAQLTATGIVMGTALYVSPEQATGATVTGSSDIYSLGVVAYECLTGEPPFLADQPLAIAIMHKHDPVPPLPGDVPRPVSDLVLAMLAKSPEGRPESARHVADRADIILNGLIRSGGEGSTTAGLPVVPDFPTGPDDQYEYPERSTASPLSRHRLAAAGMGVALCGVAVVVAVLLTSGNHPMTPAGSTSPAAPANVGRPTTASVRATQASSSVPGTNLDTAPQTTVARSAQPTPSHPSPTPTRDAPPTSGTPTASATKSASPSASSTSPTASSSSPSSTATTPPTSTATATPGVVVVLGKAIGAAGKEGSHS
jgi:serine/threonine protein kinase